MEWQATVEDALQREITAGRLTRPEADELHRRLDLLAFNMTAAGHAGEAHKPVAALWVLHLRIDKQRAYLPAPPRHQARAARWWSRGTAAGLLVEGEDSITFVDRALQEYFCLHFCLAHPLNIKLLRLASRESFRAVWRRWAEQDSTLAGQLNALLLGEWQTKGGLRAALPLRFLGDMRAVAPLLTALNDTDQGVCIRAAMALGMLGDLRALEPLNTRQMQEKRLVIRVPMIEALGDFGEPALPILSALLENTDQNVARASIRGLGRTGTPEAAVPLVAILTSQGKHITNEPLSIENVLQEIDTINNAITRQYHFQVSGEKVPPAEREEISLVRARMKRYIDEQERAQKERRKAEAASDALGLLGELAIPALSATLNHPNRSVREYIAKALSNTHAAQAAKPLLEQLKRELTEHSPSAQDAIGRALIGLRCLESANLLFEALKEQDVKEVVIRCWIACALAEIGDQRAIESLRLLSQEMSHPSLRRTAAEALRRFGEASD